MDKMRANALLDALSNAIGQASTSTTESKIKYGGYSVVAVLNPGEGPDEQLIEVADITWDHSLGVLRLELAL